MRPSVLPNRGMKVLLTAFDRPATTIFLQYREKAYWSWRTKKCSPLKRGAVYKAVNSTKGMFNARLLCIWALNQYIALLSFDNASSTKSTDRLECSTGEGCTACLQFCREPKMSVPKWGIGPKPPHGRIRYEFPWLQVAKGSTEASAFWVRAHIKFVLKFAYGTESALGHDMVPLASTMLGFE